VVCGCGAQIARTERELAVAGGGRAAQIVNRERVCFVSENDSRAVDSQWRESDYLSRFGTARAGLTAAA
jgi:hypothetical protein